MTGQQPGIDREALLDALQGTRAMVGVIAESLIPALEKVTLPQFRALVLLRARGRTPAGVLATRLGVTASTGTRLVVRLVRGGWVARDSDDADRRLITLELTPKGARLVDEARTRRLQRLEVILGRMAPDERDRVVDALRRFAAAAGEPSPESLDLLALDGAPEDGAPQR